LNFDQTAGTEPDDVHIDLGPRIFDVIEVDDRLPFDDPRADGGDAVSEDRARSVAKPRFQRVGDGDERAGDGCGSRSAVGLDHVGVNMDRPGAEGLGVDHGSEAPADQALDLGRSAVGLAFLASRRAPGEHRVFGREPADAFPFEERRNLVRNLSRDENRRRSRAVQGTAGAGPDEPSLNRHRADLARRAAVVSRHYQGYPKVEERDCESSGRQRFFFSNPQAEEAGDHS
jgi:hypothetical protein